jgi:hypothetical protein
MPPRGNRLACSVKSVDGAMGSYDVYPGAEPNSIARIDPIKWNKETSGVVQEGAFSVIGEMGMTGQVLLINQYQWRALADAKLENFFYAAVLWGGGKSPFKVIEDAQTMLKRGK